MKRLLLLLLLGLGVQAEGLTDDWVNLQRLEPSFKLEMAYATPNNFLKAAVYPQALCLLHRPVAERLKMAQQALLQQGYGLKLWDCYRPLSVQKKMWAIVPDDRYVADPSQGSRHNRGAAVDVTLVTAQGQPLEMPTGFDDFSPKASPSARDQWTPEARTHFEVLRKAMTDAGFAPLASEWWHFDYNGWKAYPVSDFPLAER
ncbi:M15 family metallopeptidase [Anthocerotibacter panamensis]|uniref:M15 family metallopeptidase n=1 Tax=Anthocerotibacter panamensis TaxID=2857077 RepID=UPI001FD917DC|nr:M15 family metallopeptidase [Anthocerotibacter panamensis]